MPQRDTSAIGAPCWVDLLTSDPDRARTFYGEIFGWTSDTAGEEFGNYINFAKDGKRVAGGMKNDGSQGMPDTWNVHLSTDDAEKTMENATANGAAVIVPPMQVGELGTMSMYIDPTGAAVGA
ncbi:MAG TPA: VOC family protein, partial [Acidimicrobiia bacterium]|nr:VOC family protein [Acidimicrobiia bacterium]